MTTEISLESKALAHPTVGNILAILSGLSFLFLCMILPLVGRAGQAEGLPYATKNFVTFLLFLLVTLALSGAATYSKIQRRKLDQSPFPRWSAMLTGGLVLVLIFLLSGLFSI